MYLRQTPEFFYKTLAEGDGAERVRVGLRVNVGVRVRIHIRIKLHWKLWIRLKLEPKGTVTVKASKGPRQQ